MAHDRLLLADMTAGADSLPNGVKRQQLSVLDVGESLRYDKS